MPSAWGDSWGDAWGDSWGARDVVATPTTAALVTVGFAPVLKLAVIPPPASLAFSFFVPSVLTPVVATPTTVALVTTTFVPIVGSGSTIIVAANTLTLTTYAPSTDVSAIEDFWRWRPDPPIPHRSYRLEEETVYRGRPDML